MIPYFDYRPAHRRIRTEIDAAIRRVLDSGRLILDAEGRAFEEEFAAWTGIPHAVGVASGTDALILALRALDVGRDDEVITVCNAGVPPVAAIRAVGATPRFVDVRPDTLLLDAAALPAALGERTRCIVPVHLYGQPVDLDPVLEFAAAHGLSVVEDCAQAHGASYRGRHVGGFGDIGCFSFYPTKNLGAYGDGGLCVTGREDLYDRLRMLRMYGFRDDGHAHCEGLNSRLDELQAAILRVKLGHLAEAMEERRASARRYVAGLAGSEFVPPGTTPETTHGYHLFVVQADDRRTACLRLDAAGVGFGIHYPEPVHCMTAYRFLRVPEGTLPVSERACHDVLSLPLYPGLESASVDRVVRALGDKRGSSHKCMHDLAPGRSASAVGRRCGCARARYAAVQSSVAQLTAACAGPALGGGPARRQPNQTQAADSMALTWRRTVKDSGTRPRLSPMFCAGAERSLTVQPPWNGQSVTIPVSGVAGLSGSPQLLSRYRRCSLVT